MENDRELRSDLAADLLIARAEIETLRRENEKLKAEAATLRQENERLKGVTGNG